ncbi:hypothetical protein ACFFIS_02660 [Virgibacillus soli]|uniref:Uncharacterized protein n=1 Tax=Paracerasibacillus soli TaxID=480284 RepID=A0ABU5CQ30_9BACI|nr:hypothetical protein [Virgibacillus soli]MDY0408444.1 hypothetical protein [Virgibacillus soli]
MKKVTFFTALLTIFTFLFKWRYRIINMLLAIRFLRKFTVRMSLNLPILKKKVLPSLLKPMTK